MNKLSQHKFRAWSIKEETMYVGFDLYSLCTESDGYDQSLCYWSYYLCENGDKYNIDASDIIMQCVGGDDAIDVYVGDIIELDCNIKVEVVLDYKLLNQLELDTYYFELFKVIGNKHENQELYKSINY